MSFLVLSHETGEQASLLRLLTPFRNDVGVLSLEFVSQKFHELQPDREGDIKGKGDMSVHGGVNNVRCEVKEWEAKKREQT